MSGKSLIQVEVAVPKFKLIASGRIIALTRESGDSFPGSAGRGLGYNAQCPSTACLPAFLTKSHESALITPCSPLVLSLQQCLMN